MAVKLLIAFLLLAKLGYTQITSTGTLTITNSAVTFVEHKVDVSENLDSFCGLLPEITNCGQSVSALNPLDISLTKFFNDYCLRSSSKRSFESCDVRTISIPESEYKKITSMLNTQEKNQEQLNVFFSKMADTISDCTSLRIGESVSLSVQFKTPKDASDKNVGACVVCRIIY